MSLLPLRGELGARATQLLPAGGIVLLSTPPAWGTSWEGVMHGGVEKMGLHVSFLGDGQGG